MTQMKIAIKASIALEGVRTNSYRAVLDREFLAGTTALIRVTFQVTMGTDASNSSVAIIPSLIT